MDNLDHRPEHSIMELAIPASTDIQDTPNIEADSVETPSLDVPSGIFHLFQGLPREIRDMIWEEVLRMVKILPLRFVPMTSGQSEDEEELPAIGFQTVSHELAMISSCREGREVAKRILRTILPSADKNQGILFDPDNMAVHIVNLDELIDLSDFDIEAGDALNWLSPKSYLGENIRSLVVNGEHIAFEGGREYYGFSDNHWQHVLRHMFKDVEKAICLIDYEIPGTYFDLDDDEWEDTDRRYRIDEGFASSETQIVDLDRLEEIINSFFADTTDTLDATFKSFDEIRPKSGKQRPCPRLCFQQGGSYANGLDLKYLTIKPSNQRERFPYDTHSDW